MPVKDLTDRQEKRLTKRMEDVPANLRALADRWELVAVSCKVSDEAFELIENRIKELQKLMR
jgi:hypothetical protein